MKKILISLFGAFLALSMLCGCGGGKTSDTSIDKSSQSESSSSIAEESNGSSQGESFSSIIEESSSKEDDPPVVKEEDDLATCEHASSIAPDKYGVVADLTVQNETLSQNSTAALKGAFNGNGEDTIVYKGYMVWTFAQLRLKEHYGEAVDLTKKSLVYDVKAENCGVYSSLTVVDKDGSRSKEVFFAFQDPKKANPFISIEALKGGWYRITVDLFYTFYEDTAILEKGAEILIMFNNEECDDPEENSVFYLDNARLIDAESAVDLNNLVVNNPDGYYDKQKSLNVKFVGNDCLLFPNCSDYFADFCNATSANAVSNENDSADHFYEHYELAFGENGYMSKEKIDVLFIQGFRVENDVVAFGRFLSKLYEVSPTTEVKIFPWENEAPYAYRAAELYGVDLVDWRKATLTLQADHGFTEENLKVYDGVRPDRLAGFIGSLMAYMDLYGENVDLETIKVVAGSLSVDLPGEYNERDDKFQLILSLTAHIVLGEDFNNPSILPPDDEPQEPTEENDISTSGNIDTRAPQNYGTLANLTIQSEVVSMASKSALMGVFNADGAEPYRGYMIWTFVELKLDDHFGDIVDLADKTLVFDLKTENMGIYSSFIVVDSKDTFSSEVTFEYSSLPSSNAKITRVALTDGWYRYTLDFSKAFSNAAILSDAASILITFGNEKCAQHDADSYFYLDNVKLFDTNGDVMEGSSSAEEDSSIPDDSGDIEPPIEEEYIDFATLLTFRSQAPGYGAITSFSYDTEIVSDTSTASLKGVFNNKGANVYQDYIVWTFAELCLEEDFEYALDLNDMVLYYDMLTENCGTYSSFILIAPDGTRSQEITFAFNDPSQTNEGITSELLSNGWYHVEIDFSTAYADDPTVLDEVSSVLIMFTNQDCDDPNADSVYYLDNMGFDIIIDDEYPDDELPLFTEDMDAATNCPVESKVLDENNDVLSVLTVQTETVCTAVYESTAALQGVFPAATTAPTKTWVAFNFEEYFGAPTCLTNGLLYFDLQTVNCGGNVSILFVAPDGTYSPEISFNPSEEWQESENIIWSAWGDGWTGVVVYIGAIFAESEFSLESVSQMLISFTNEGCEYPDEESAFFIDNLISIAVPDEEEMEDWATNCPFESRTPEICGTSNVTTLQSEVVSENSTKALMGVFNNDGADVHDGYAVWTWTSVCIEDFIGMAVPCVDTILTYDVKTENCGIYSSFILVAPDGTRSQEITFAFNDPAQTFAGITCEELYDGWYRVTLDFNEAFKNEPIVLEEVSSILIMFTNQGCENHEEDSIFYIDNMIFTDATIEDF